MYLPHGIARKTRNRLDWGGSAKQPSGKCGGCLEFDYRTTRTFKFAYRHSFRNCEEVICSSVSSSATLSSISFWALLRLFFELRKVRWQSLVIDFYATTFAAFAGLQGSTLSSTHRTLYRFAGSSSVSRHWSSCLSFPVFRREKMVQAIADEILGSFLRIKALV